MEGRKKINMDVFLNCESCKATLLQSQNKNIELEMSIIGRQSLFMSARTEHYVSRGLKHSRRCESKHDVL